MAYLAKSEAGVQPQSLASLDAPPLPKLTAAVSTYADTCVCSTNGDDLSMFLRLSSDLGTMLCWMRAPWVDRSYHSNLQPYCKLLLVDSKPAVLKAAIALWRGLMNGVYGLIDTSAFIVLLLQKGPLLAISPPHLPHNINHSCSSRRILGRRRQLPYLTPPISHRQPAGITTA